MIDAIRRRQIDEVMNYDRNINIQTMISTGSAVSKMDDNTDLQSMQDQTVLDTAATSLGSVTTLLDQKRAAVVSSTVLSCIARRSVLSPIFDTALPVEIIVWMFMFLS